MGEHAFPLTGFVCKEAHVTIAEVKVSFLLIRTLKRLVRKRKYDFFFIKNVFGGRIRTPTNEEYYIQNSGVLSTELLQIMDHSCDLPS